MNLQPVHPRPPSAELKLIRKALRRLTRHPDNKGAILALEQIAADVRRTLGKDTPPLYPTGFRTKDYARQRDFIET